MNRFSELEKLLSALADDKLDAAGRTRLGELLDGDPEACEFYLDYMSLDAHLEQELGSIEPVQFFEKLPEAQIAEATTIYLATRQPPPPPVWKQPWTLAAAAAVVAGLFLISLVTQSERDGPGGDPMDDAVAVLTDSIGAQFGAGGLKPTRGDLLPKGLLKLEAGIARVQFYSGAEVILEGPVEFELRGNNIAACLSGDFRASVPPAAQGFTVLSPKVEMVDLGTEFGASIGDDGATEVHVFEGEVEVYDANSGRDPASRDLLTAGYGLEIASSGSRSDMLADNMAFLSEDEVLQRMRLHAAARHDAWQRFSAESLDVNPDVMLHFPFVSDDLEGRNLLD
ncbi:MAG: FecR domain-containing protein, partial [Verrucomicrobiales bacterium]